MTKLLLLLLLVDYYVRTSLSAAYCRANVVPLSTAEEEPHGERGIAPAFARSFVSTSLAKFSDELNEKFPENSHKTVFFFY